MCSSSPEARRTPRSERDRSASSPSGEDRLSASRPRTALYRRLIVQGESFWSCVYVLYMDREITRGTLREVIHKGLVESSGNYRIVYEIQDDIILITVVKIGHRKDITRKL